jgi:DNA polymerase phi
MRRERLPLSHDVFVADVKNLDWKEIAYPAIRHTPILSSQNLPTLAKILKDSQAAEDDNAPSTSQGSWKPQLHFVWTQIFDALLGDSGVAGQASYQDFFRSVVDGTSTPQLVIGYITGS